MFVITASVVMVRIAKVVSAQATKQSCRLRRIIFDDSQNQSVSDAEDAHEAAMKYFEKIRRGTLTR